MPPELEEGTQEELVQEDAILDETPAEDVDEGEASPEDESVNEGEIEHDEVLAADGDEGEASPVESSEDIDYTYKFNGEVYEFNDELKEMIKSPEHAERLRDLVEKADFVEFSKERQQYLRDENQNLQYTESQRQQAVGQMQSMVQQGDLKPFMDAWGIDDNKLAQYMHHRLQLQEMDPAQRAEYERNEQARLQSYTLQNQNTYLQSQNEQLQQQQVAWQVDQTLSNQEFGQYVQNYDSQKGAGAFKAEVARLGDYYWHAGRGVVPPDQLAREVVQKWYQEPAQQQQQHIEPSSHRNGATRGERRQRVVSGNKKPSMPRVRGSGGSPVKSMPKSIADIRRLSQERYGG